MLACPADGEDGDAVIAPATAAAAAAAAAGDCDVPACKVGVAAVVRGVPLTMEACVSWRCSRTRISSVGKVRARPAFHQYCNDLVEKRESMHLLEALQQALQSHAHQQSGQGTCEACVSSEMQ